MNEADLQKGVIEMARVLGFMVAHFRPAQTAKGWRTPVEGDAGFPDLVLAGHGRVIFAELKGDTGRISPWQEVWLSTLREAEKRLEHLDPRYYTIGPDGAYPLQVYLWTPQDWTSGAIEKVLRAGITRPGGGRAV